MQVFCLCRLRSYMHRGKWARVCDAFYVLSFRRSIWNSRKRPNYPHEIIEFPAVLVDLSTGEQIAKFHSFVRPRINPVLSDFCTRLTGITQAQVDSAPYFPAVYTAFTEWLVEKKLLMRDHNDKLKIEDKTPSWTLLTDGSADICRFLHLQCLHDKIPFPFHWAGKYANLKKLFQSAYKPKSKMRLEQMLEHLGMEFEGRLHR